MKNFVKVAAFPVLFLLTGWMHANQPEVGQRFRDCPECPDMVAVPSGTFRMGAPESEEGYYDDERPVHTVSVRSFAVGIYEVTFAEWAACAAAGGCGGRRPDDFLGRGRAHHPVVYVSWEDAQLYVLWLSVRTGERYRLLSESEWEYAARAGTTGPFHTGATITTDEANFDGRYSGGLFWGRTLEAGSFPANGFGLHDVHGNVWEWVQDCWNSSYEGAPVDGSAWESGNCSYRVLRGGDWRCRPRLLRSASRNRNGTGVRRSYFGFRVARTLTP